MSDQSWGIPATLTHCYKCCVCWYNMARHCVDDGAALGVILAPCCELSCCRVACCRPKPSWPSPGKVAGKVPTGRLRVINCGVICAALRRRLVRAPLQRCMRSPRRNRSRPLCLGGTSVRASVPKCGNSCAGRSRISGNHLLERCDGQFPRATMKLRRRSTISPREQ